MSIRVFLVDDHAVVREGLRLILERERDMSVIGEAGSGRQAVRQVEQLNPDVVIMDIALPELNGFEATRQITRLCPSTRVVILSMYSTAEQVFLALQAGALGYVLKDVAGQEVVKAIRKVYAGCRYLSQQISETVITDYLKRRGATEVKSPLEQLTLREREILQLVVEGKTSAEIAKILYISPKTVETYRSKLMSKLGIHDIPGLVKFAIQNGLTPLK